MSMFGQTAAQAENPQGSRGVVMCWDMDDVIYI